MSVVDVFIEEARSWIGTPWQHQARLKGIGVDCVGVVQKSYEKATGKKCEYEINYHRIPPIGREERLEEILGVYFDKKEGKELERGDVMLFSFKNKLSNHVGIYTGDGNMVHAWLDVNKVVEMPMDDAWKRSVKVVYKLKEKEE